MNQFEQLRKQKNAAFKAVNKDIEQLKIIAQESNRVSIIARDSRMILNNIDREFSERTKLNKVDISLLFVAVALQCLRQYIVTNDAFRFNEAKDADEKISKSIEDEVKKSDIDDKYKKILLNPVPYDAIRRTDEFKEKVGSIGVSGSNHRYTVLGHDPLLGWFFGTLNIMTSSLTKNEIMPVIWPSYLVENCMLKEKIDFGKLAMDGARQAIYDYKILVASVIKQALHLASDAFTKMGLPVPIINTIAPDLNSKLLSENCRIDTYSVTRGFLLSTLINSIIIAIHGLFYNRNEYKNRDMYEVKTRKILDYSNTIATSSNIITSVLSQNYKILDSGGFIVTIYRLINDYKFIRDVKKEFLIKEFDKIVQDDEYNF